MKVTDLDDPEVFKHLDPSGMRHRLRGLPDQFARFNSGPEPEIPLPVLDMNLHFDMGDLQVIE